MNRNKFYRAVLLVWLATLLAFPALSRVATQIEAHDQTPPATSIACTTGGGSSNDCGGVTGGGGG